MTYGGVPALFFSLGAVPASLLGSRLFVAMPSGLVLRAMGVLLPGAAVFLGLKLEPQACVASEAVTAVLMHLTKSVAYGRHAALSLGDSLRGVLLGGSFVLGSWTGRKLTDRIPERWFGRLPRRGTSHRVRLRPDCGQGRK